jgi:hypothetical protein
MCVPLGLYMQPMGLVYPLGAYLCPLGLKCVPPLLCVRPLGSFKLLGTHVCPLGAHLCPLGLFYAPWGSSVRPPRHTRPLLGVRAPPSMVVSRTIAAGRKDEQSDDGRWVVRDLDAL